MNAAAVSLKRLGLWIGPDDAAANAMYQRARELGMSKARAEVLAHIASRRDCWAFAKTIAKWVGCHVRTVQRAIAQGKSLGLVKTARGKKDEVPPGASAPIPCGWSHKWIIGRGLFGPRLHEEIAKARVRWLTNIVQRKVVPLELQKLVPRAKTPQPRRAPTGMTNLEWLQSELGEIAARPRDGPTE